MDTKRTIQQAAQATIGMLALLIVLTSSPTHALDEATPVRTLDGVRLHEPNPQREEMLDWALKQYRAAGLQMPTIDVYFHGDSSGCGGYLGYTKKGRVDLCVRLAMERQPQRIVLHELAHAWAEVHLDEELRTRFMQLRNLPGWNITSDDWKVRGTEQAAEIIAWGLGDGTVLPMISGDCDPSALADGFLLLTGSQPVHDGI